MLLWLGSFIFVMSVIAGAYWYLSTSRHEAESLKVIGSSFSILNNTIIDRRDRMVEGVNSIADYQSVLSTVSMIDAYQDVDDYQPLVFNPEKQKLARELEKYGQASDFSSLVMHDSKEVITAFYINNKTDPLQSGYYSYREGKSFVVTALGKGGDFLETAQELSSLGDHRLFDRQFRLRIGSQGLVMEVSAPLERQLSNLSSRNVGGVHATYHLNDHFIKGISDKTGLPLSILLPDGRNFGDFDVASIIDGLPDIPALQSNADTFPVFYTDKIEGHIFGVTRLPMKSGEYIYFMFADGNKRVNASLTDFEQAVYAALILGVLILVPSIAYYVNRVLTIPIERLLLGVEGIHNGQYQALTGIEGSDEFSYLARSINAMTQSLLERERALRDSEERLTALVKYTPNKLHIKDMKGRFTLINPMAEVVLGITNAEVQGKAVADFMSSDKAVAFDNHDRAVIETRTPVEMEETFHLEDGEHTFLTVKFPILDMDGHIVAVGGSGYEITERKQAENALREHKLTLEKKVAERTAEVQEKANLLEKALESEREATRTHKMLMDALENIPLMIMLLDANRHLIMCNRSYIDAAPTIKDILVPGTPYEDIVRISAERGIIPEYADNPNEWVRVRLARLEGPQTPIVRQAIDGRWILTMDHHIPDGSILITRTDITSLKVAEIELERQRAEMELALESEKRYSSLQRQFVSLVSHEFRTPLTIIDSNAQRMMRRKDNLAPEKLVERCQNIRGSVDNMVELIETTLYASRLDAEKVVMNAEAYDIVELVTNTCRRLEDTTSSHDFSIDFDELPDAVYGDRQFIEHVFTNIVSNAIKYAADAPLIKVWGWTDEDMVVIAVKDSGIGISQKDLPQMFERYFRAKTSIGIKGTGLGLSVCKEFVEMHGGTIAVESEEGEGTTFTVRLPIGEQNQGDQEL